MKLKDTRKNDIPNLVASYKKLVDDTFEVVGRALPDFQDRENKEGEIIKTAEEQLFNYIQTRNAALDNANKMLLKINELEIELENPEAYYEQKQTEQSEKEEEVNSVSWTKKKAIKKEQ